MIEIQCIALFSKPYWCVYPVKMNDCLMHDCGCVDRDGADFAVTYGFV